MSRITTFSKKIENWVESGVQERQRAADLALQQEDSVNRPMPKAVAMIILLIFVGPIVLGLLGGYIVLCLAFPPMWLLAVCVVWALLVSLEN